MSAIDNVDKVISFLQGGQTGCLWDILAPAICGDCDPPENCNGCDGAHIITEIENQVAKEGLDFMRHQVKEWVKSSKYSKGNDGG
ncbi:hypothetical protein ES707_15975 [subsurface metagenome]